jgi:hypothetical protein
MTDMRPFGNMARTKTKTADAFFAQASAQAID